MAARSTSLQTRLGLVACVFLAIMMVAIGLSALSVRTWDRSLDARSSARQLSGDITDLRLAFSDQETGIRGYRLSADQSFLDPYRSGVALADAMMARIADRSSSAETLALLDAVRDAGGRWRNDVAVATIDPTSPPPSDEVAKTRFDDIRHALDELDAQVNRQLDAALLRVDRAQRNTFGVLLASAIGAIAGTGLIMVLFRRWITRPLHTVVDASRRLAADDTTRMPTFASSELQEVGEAITSLQMALSRERDRAVAAYDSLEQSAALALHVRSELAHELGDLPQGWTVAGTLQPAEGIVAGDCYDVALLDQDHVYIIMIDVTGHGAGAALSALKAKAQLRAALRSRLGPGPALDFLARQRRPEDEGVYMTVLVAILDLATGVCDYASAGHPPPLINAGPTWLAPTGPLVGAFSTSWSTERVELPLGSSLMVYTDGVTEAIGPDRQRYGEDRLQAAVAGADDTDAEAIVQHVVGQIDRFCSGTQRSDDTTLLVIRRGLPVDAEPREIATVQA